MPRPDAEPEEQDYDPNSREGEESDEEDGEDYDDNGNRGDEQEGEEEYDEERAEEEEEEDDDEEEEYEDSDEDGDEYDDEYEDEPEEEYIEETKVIQEEEDNRNKCLWIICCFCCLLLILLAILLGVLLPHKKKKDVESPTMAPTTMFNSSSSGAPTQPIEVPKSAFAQPNGDTTIYEEGPLVNQPFGKEDIMMVQKGPADDPNVADAYALINFFWDEIGYPWFTQEQLEGYTVTANLCLQHIPNTNFGEPLTYSLCRLPSTFSGTELETARSTDYGYTMPEDCMDQKQVDFPVGPTETEKCVDITELVQPYPPFQPGQSGTRPGSSISGRRRLQGGVAGGSGSGTANPKDPTFTDNNFKNMLFMLANTNENQPGTDEFYTRQTGANSPQLVLNFNGGGGSGSGGDGSGNGGGFGSAGPVGPPPTSAPTIPVNGTGPYEPCSVCADNDQCGVLEDKTVEVPPDVAPPQVNETASCADLENICQAGFCQPELCEQLANGANEATTSDTTAITCGGALSCPICPADTEMTIPDADLKDVLSEYVPPETFEDATLTCATLEGFCQSGICGKELCDSIPQVVNEPCGCTAPGGNPTTTAPGGGSTGGASGPTEPPTISLAPTISPAPTYKANWNPCGICGVGPTPNPLRDDVPIEIPDNLAPPQVKDGSAMCDELEEYCQGGYCPRLTCNNLYPIREICGCPNFNTPCSICGAGKELTNAGGTVTLEAALAISGFPPTITCSDLQDACSRGYCDGSRCQAFPELVEGACGCQEAAPGLTIESSADTTLYRDGPLVDDNSGGTEDTMLAQNGPVGNEEVASSFALVQFPIAENKAVIDSLKNEPTSLLCLHHVQNTEADRVVTYSVCAVTPPDLQGGIESLTGADVTYTMPADCTTGDVSNFDVSPNTEQICVDVTGMVDKNQEFVTFMIDNMNESDQPGDRFYTRFDSERRFPELRMYPVFEL